MKKYLSFLMVFTSLNIFAQKIKNQKSSSSALNQNQVVNLLDSKLTHWEKWLGVPHSSVTGLPTGTETGNGMSGSKPLGHNDVKNVFKMEQQNGENVLHVSGEIYGGLSTKVQFENYHLQLKYKWGEKKWPPRQNAYKDSGIMFHLTGTLDDAMWNVFMMGIEFQIGEAHTGELFFAQNKANTTRPLADTRVNNKNKWSVMAPLSIKGGIDNAENVLAFENHESAADQWTTLDLYTIGGSAIYLVNGNIVNAFQNAAIQNIDKSISPLTKGKIQLQSEGAEMFYKDITIEKISDFPANIKEKAGFNGPQNWKLGVSLYTFAPHPFEQQLAMVKSTGATFIEGVAFGHAGAELKDSTIFTLSKSGFEKLHQNISNEKLRMESMYVLGGKTTKDWVRDFEMAKHLKLKYITAEPPINMLNIVDSLAGVYGIKVALHNHWNGNSQYWHPDSVLLALKNRQNLGACPDLGHYPKSGINPVDAVKKLSGHIIAMHLKDIAEYNNNKLKDIPVGTGVIKFPEIFEELKRQNFDGHIIIERDQQDKPNNLSPVNQTIKYYTETLKLPSFKATQFRADPNLPFRHAGLFNFKQSVTEKDRLVFFEALKDLENIFGVLNLQVERQISPKNKYDYGFSMEFASEAKYISYIQNPRHEDFVNNYWLRMVEDFLEVDTESMQVSNSKTRIANAPSTNIIPKESYYVGKWNIQILGTPEGDVPLEMDFRINEGKWTGTFFDKKRNETHNLKSVEVKENSILLAFNFSGFDLTIKTNRIDDDHFSGKMVDLFEVEATRKK